MHHWLLLILYGHPINDSPSNSKIWYFSMKMGQKGDLNISGLVIHDFFPYMSLKMFKLLVLIPSFLYRQKYQNVFDMHDNIIKHKIIIEMFQ